MTTPVPPALLGVSHGTSSVSGQRAVAGLLDAVAVAVPGVAVQPAHVDVEQPDVGAGFDAIAPRLDVVAVPLLLSAGYHVNVDLAQAIAAEHATPRGGGRRVERAAALGPAPELVEVLVERLNQAGLGGGPLAGADQLVLAAAGSSDRSAVADCLRVAGHLSARLGRSVGIGFLSAAAPSLEEAIAQAHRRAPRADVFVASYLLAPGHFHDLAVRTSRAAGARAISAPLLGPTDTPEALVRLVVRRYRTAASRLTTARAGAGARAGTTTLHAPSRFELEVV